MVVYVFRNYAEVTEKYIEAIFGGLVEVDELDKIEDETFEISDPVVVKNVGGKIEKSKLLTSQNKLKPIGWNLATFFSHNRIDKSESNVKQIIENDFAKTINTSSDMVDADAWLFIIHKGKFESKLKQKYF